MTRSECRSFGSRELAVQYACELLNEGREAGENAPRVGKAYVGGHDIRLIRADLV